jgi:hypothetical protein
MNRAASKMRHLAERLVVYEAASDDAAPTQRPPAYDVCEKLRPHLSTLMGKGGYRALVLRSLALANAESDGLGQISVRDDGTMDGWTAASGKSDTAPTAEASGLLLAHLLGLLVAFIGENLTLRMLRQIWPQVSATDADLDQGESK